MIDMKPEILNSAGLLNQLVTALAKKTPFSVVSVGVTESFVLAQYTILKEDEFMGHKEAYVAAQGLKRGFDHRGIRFPNTEARNMAVSALANANAVGYNMTIKDITSSYPGELTEKVFSYYNINPRYIFEANIRRVIMFSQPAKFKELLAGKKILLVCSYADEVKAAMEKNLKRELRFEVTGTVTIEEFEDIPRVKEEITAVDFDLCLLAAGINAVILAPYIAVHLGKVAFDLGQAMESLITGKIEMAGYLDRYIGLDKLMNM
jgi:hypothetical protein